MNSYVWTVYKETDPQKTLGLGLMSIKQNFDYKVEPTLGKWNVWNYWTWKNNLRPSDLEGKKQKQKLEDSLARCKNTIWAICVSQFDMIRTEEFSSCHNFTSLGWGLETELV